MDDKKNTQTPAFAPIEDPALSLVLNELGRSINLLTTYGKTHPAASKALSGTHLAMQDLFSDRKKIKIGAFNGVLLIDEQTVKTAGTLQKSLERKLVRLNITSLRIARGISMEELVQLAELLSSSDAETFEHGMENSGMSHIETEHARLQAIREGETVANENDLAGMAESGILVLEDDASGSHQGADVHVEQIVAFLKGEIDYDNEKVGDELSELASDPDRLGKMIMESVAIRQSAAELSGESLNDIILGCLRRTYDGLRKQTLFQSTGGKAELKQALLLLEESVLKKMRGLAGEDNPELDRQIVQAMREMNDELSFEIAAAQYIEHRKAIKQSKNELKQFIQSQGTAAAEALLEDSGFPGNDWQKIVIDSGTRGTGDGGLASGLNTLATVFEQLEQLMKSETAHDSRVKDLLGQANENLDDTIDHTREKLEALSHQINDGEASTIGGQAHSMSREELLTALSEVAQELMQPLTAINASVEMMLNGFVGSVTDEQHDLLSLAANSGEHLKFLMNMLITIVGCPANKGIDSRFHTTSEQVVLMQDAENEPEQLSRCG
jgi:signal transduction histidine kinase